MLEVPAQGAPGVLGDPAAGWHGVAVVYAKVEPLYGRELEIGRQVDGRTSHKVTLRYRPGVSTTMRLRLPKRREATQRILHITSVLNQDERDDVLVLMAAEVAA